MEKRVGRMLAALDRVDALLTSAPEFASLVGSTARASLTATVAELQAHITAQNENARLSIGATATQRQLVRAMRRQMRTIASAAQLKLRESPDFVKLEMPKGRPNVQQLLAAAEGMSGAATAHREVLAAVGLPADFLDQLAAAVQAVRDSISGRSAHVSVRTGATKSLRTLASDVSHVLKVLDGLVVPSIPANDPGRLLVRWQQAKRIGKTAMAGMTAPKTEASMTTGSSAAGTTTPTATSAS